jgi:hypothetical protein
MLVRHARAGGEMVQGTNRLIKAARVNGEIAYH